MIEKLGKFFTKSGSDAFRLVHYESAPTVTFRNLETGEQVTEALGEARKKFAELIPDFQHVPNADRVTRPVDSEPPEQWRKENIAKTGAEWLAGTKLAK